MNAREWERFAGFFADQGLITTRPGAAELLTNELLPARAAASRRARPRRSRMPSVISTTPEVVRGRLSAKRRLPQAASRSGGPWPTEPCQRASAKLPARPRNGA